MRRVRNAFLAALFALVLSLGAAACGGDDDTQGEGDPAESDEGAPTGDDVGETGEEGDNLGGEAED
ncbi:MAG: hypothetical protein ACRDJP_10125 [Actinomycetota bacterium]